MAFYDHTRANMVHARLSPLSNQQLAEAMVAAANRLVKGYEPEVEAPEAMASLLTLRGLKQRYNAQIARRAAAKLPKFDAETDCDTVAGGLFEIRGRIIGNRNNASDVFIQPVTEAVKWMDDISDGRAVAICLCRVKLPSADPVAPVGFGKNTNPFRA